MLGGTKLSIRDLMGVSAKERKIERVKCIEKRAKRESSAYISESSVLLLVHRSNKVREQKFSVYFSE